MPEQTRVPAVAHHRQRPHRARDRPRPHGRRHRHRLPPLHQERQQVENTPAGLLASRSEARERNLARRHQYEQSGCGLIMTEFTSADGLSRMREVQAQALPHLLRRRAPHLRPDLRLQPRNPRRIRPASAPTPASTLVDLNLGLPRQARRRLQRGLGPPARPSRSSSSHLPRRPRRHLHPLHRQVPYGLERQATSSASTLAKLAEDCGLQRRRPARPHPRGRLLRPGPLAVHRRRQGRRLHPRHRQRRHPHPGRRRRHDPPDRLRCSNDRPRRPSQSLDFPPNRPIHRHRRLRPRPPISTATA